MRYILKLSYCGAAFCGWQIQNGAPSVQQSLQYALSTLLREDVSVTGAGRTDTGVNAVGYVAHFDSTPISDTELLRYKLNAILPKEIVIHDILQAPDNFHARFDATNREYTYFLHRVKDPFIENYSLFYPYDLDFELMNRAAALLPGTRDFRCFEKVGADNKTSICTVTLAGWHPYVPTHAGLMGKPSGDYWYFRIGADRFLRNMVRATVGTLIDVGRGKRSIDEFKALLDGGTRCDAGESVPGKALFLSKVEY